MLILSIQVLAFDLFPSFLFMSSHWRERCGRDPVYSCHTLTSPPGRPRSGPGVAVTPVWTAACWCTPPTTPDPRRRPRSSSPVSGCPGQPPQLDLSCPRSPRSAGRAARTPTPWLTTRPDRSRSRARGAPCWRPSLTSPMTWWRSWDRTPSLSAPALPCRGRGRVLTTEPDTGST